MNSKMLTFAGLAAVIGLGATFAVSAQTPPAASSAAYAAMGQRERHPEMRAALKALRNAKERLEHAARDYDGHRAKALEHTNEAIREVERALETAK